MNQVSEYYQTQLRQHPDKQQAIDYLKQRGLSGDVAKRFGIGFAAEGWDNLMSTHGATAPAQKALLDTGMLTQNEKERTYDRFRHRIMFPIHDHRGRVVGFGGRVLGDGEPKYLNSPETPIFHKGAELYGLFAARGGIKEYDGVLVVEGYMDVVALAQAGISNAVATLGTATTPMHLQRLFRHTQNITFSFDGDRAGKAAAWKALQTCLSLLQDGFQISFLFLPDGEDPDTMVRQVGKEGFLELLKQAMPLPEFLLNTLQAQADITRLDGRARLAKLAEPLVKQLPNGMLKNLLVERLALITQVQEGELRGRTQDSAGAKPTRGNRQKNSSPSTVSLTPVRRAMSLLLQYPQFIQEFTILQPVQDEHVRGMSVIHSLRQACQESADSSTATLLERYREQNFFSTLSQLAFHQHNNMETLTDEEAVALIRANNSKIVEDYNKVELEKATKEFEYLATRASAVELSEGEKTRKQQLAEFIRGAYSTNSLEDSDT